MTWKTVYHVLSFVYHGQISTIGATSTVTVGFRQTAVRNSKKKVTRKCLWEKTVLTYLLIYQPSHSTWDYHEINSINYEKWLYKK